MAASSGSARRSLIRGAACCAALLLAACASAPPQTPAVRYALETASAPIVQRIHVLELDLDRVRLETTPGDRSGGREYRARLTSDFAAVFGYDAAVNGGYFTPFRGGSPGGEDYYPHVGDAVDVSGAAIAFGREASPIEASADERVNAILCIKGVRVAIVDGQSCGDDVDHALAAGPRLLADGAVRDVAPFGAAYASARHPRTALGLDRRARKAWLVVVDGRQEGFSDGASLPELTAILQSLGAADAINLDGGGSTTLVLQRDGAVTVVNSPIHTGVPGRERPVANHLGVRVAP
ncbi:MAG: phosphodiester glycosidase family protein [Hyphomonadaceae bacterium]|nr:phosphodiester glycosidase family protein [Hyphomonadaceae bacterium]